MSSAQQCVAAMVDFLKEQRFSLQANITAPERPQVERESSTLQIQVYSEAEEETKIGRGGCVQQAYQISLLVTREIGPDMPRQRIMPLITEIKDAVRNRSMAGCTWSGTTTEVLWDDEANKNQDQLTSLLRVLYTEITQ